MPKASTFGLRTATQMVDSDTFPMLTNAGENVRLPVSEARSLVGPGWSATVNAYNEDEATDELKIQAAISRAVSTGKSIVFIPSSMLPFDASLVTFNSAIKMAREGGNFATYDALAYGATADGIVDDTVSVQAVLDALPAVGGSAFFPAGRYLLTSDITIPATTNVAMAAEAQFTGAVTLYIDGTIDVPPIQIFGSDLAVRFGTSCRIDYVRGEWFGMIPSNNASAPPSQYSLGNQTALVRALDSMTVAANNHVRTIRLGAGCFWIEGGGFTFTTDRTNLIGASSGKGYDVAGYPATELKWTGATVPIGVDLGSNASGVKYCRIENILVHGNGVVTLGISAYNGMIDKCEVRGTTAQGVLFGPLTNQACMVDTTIVDNDGDGFVADGLSATIYQVTRCNVRENGGAGLRIRAGKLAHFQDCVVESNVGPGAVIHARDEANTSLRQLHFTNVWFEGNSTAGNGYDIEFLSDNVASAVIRPRRIQFDDCCVSSIVATGAKWVNLRDATDIKFRDCIFENGDGALTATEKVVDSGNNVDILFEDCQAGSSPFPVRGEVSFGVKSAHDTTDHALVAFEVLVYNDAGVLKGRIGQPGASNNAGYYTEQITGASATLTAINDTTTADASNGFIIGMKLSSGATNALVLNTADELAEQASFVASIVENTTGTAVTCRAKFTSRNINGVTRTRLEIHFNNAASGAAFALTTANIGASANISVVVLGFLG